MGTSPRTARNVSYTGLALTFLAYSIPFIGPVLGTIFSYLGPVGAAASAIISNLGGLGTVGTLLQVAGAVLAVTARQPREQSTNESPAYSLDQFRNPVKGDAVIPVVYGDPGDSGDLLGARVAPIYLQAFSTPTGYGSYQEEHHRAHSRGESLSALVAVCHGPVERIGDHQFGSQPVYTASRREIRAVTGQTNYVVGKRGVPHESIRVRVTNRGGKDEFRGLNVVEKEVAFQGNGSRTVFKLNIDADDELADEADLSFQIADSHGADRTTLGDSTDQMVHCFPLDPHTIILNTQDYVLPAGAVMFVTFSVRRWYGLIIGRAKNAGGQTILQFFDETVSGTTYSKPTNGDTIEVEFDSPTSGGLEFGVRHGGNAQLTPAGFDSIRQTYSQRKGLGFNTPVTFTTNEEVDNVVVSIATGSAGFRRFNKEGKVLAVHADFRLEFRADGETEWIRLPDPRGTTNSKRHDEFRIVGEVGASRIISLSIRGLLRQWNNIHPRNQGGIDRLRTWTAARRKWQVRITRMSREQGLSNQSVADSILLQSHREEVDIALTYAGVALAYWHNAHPRIVGGGVPQYTCRTTGIRKLPAVSGSAWTTSEDSRGNPMWAALDLITDKFYGAGAQFTLDDNIDMTSAEAAATWCDGNETLEDGVETEKRARIDYAADSRASLMKHVSQMLTSARVVPVLQGNRWRFPIMNKEDDLTAVPVITDGTVDGRVENGSVALSHDTIASEVTELEIEFFDEDAEFERSIVPFTPEQPATQPRRRKVTLYGVRRRSEATRYGAWLYAQATWTPRQLRVRLAASIGSLRLEAGDVFRLVSTRTGIDTYFRLDEISFGIESFTVLLTGKEYIPQIYGQSFGHTRILRPDEPQSLPTSPYTPPRTAPTRLPSRRKTLIRPPRPRGRVRRIA